MGYLPSETSELYSAHSSLALSRRLTMVILSKWEEHYPLFYSSFVEMWLHEGRPRARQVGSGFLT